MKNQKFLYVIKILIVMALASTDVYSQVVVSVRTNNVRLNNYQVGVNNYYKGKLYFNDGSTKNGEISFPLNNTYKAVVQLLQKPDSIRVEYPLASLNKMVYIHKGERYMMEYKKTPLYDYKILVRVLAVGKLDLYATLDASKVERYFYRDEDEQELKFLKIQGLIKRGFHKKKAIEFFNDCPIIVEKLKSKEFKSKTVRELVVFYNKNCS